MLVIARRKGESIVIGDDVEIVVAEVSRTTVKLAISAPRGRRVLRGEVHRSIETANRTAAETAVADVAKALPLPGPDALRPLSATAIGTRNVTPVRQAADAPPTGVTGSGNGAEP